MKNLYFIFLFCSLPVFGQSLVDINEVEFYTEAEEKAVKSYLKGEKKDYFSIFFAVSPEINFSDLKNARSIYQSALAEINTKRFNKLKKEKKISYVYDKIHDRLLKKYETNNNFSLVFESGKYNCVSSTALFSLVLDHFEVPYTIREKPTHVYLISYPEEERILIETTDPSGGFDRFNDAYKKEFVKNLNKSKLISDEEYQNEDHIALFDKYYFNDEDITLDQLVGIQYTNDAIYRIDNNDYEGAFNQLEKAYLFNPVEDVARMLFITGVKVLEDAREDNLQKRIEMIARLSKYEDYGVSDEMIRGEFSGLTRELLIDQGDENLYEESFQRLIDLIENEDYVSLIKKDYYYERGRKEYNEGRFKQASGFFEKAFLQNRKNSEIKNIWVNCISREADNQSNIALTAEYLEGYYFKYPELQSNGHLTSMLASAYLKLFSYYFQFEEPEKAVAFMNKFEKLFKEQENININSSEVAQAYSDAAVYYFKRYKKTKAREYLDRGLLIAPGNFELLQRKRMLK